MKKEPIITWADDRKSFTMPDVVGLFSALKTGVGFADTHIDYKIHQELNQCEPAVEELTEHGKYDFKISSESDFRIRVSLK